MAGELRTPGAVCDVLALAAQSSWTGELVVLDADSQRSIYLDAGSVVGAATNVSSERLGETLYSFGVITRAQLDAVIASSTASGKRLGETAIELEFVSPEDLFPMMARQVEEVFFAALRVGEGAFYLFDRYDETLLPRRHTMSCGQLLMEGARRMDEMRFFRERIPNDGYIPQKKTGDKSPPPELMDAFDQSDGKRSIAEIGRRTGQLEFEVTRAMFQLLQGGFITVSAPRPQGAVAIVAAFNPALIDIHARCDAAGKGNDLRDSLSRFATGALVFDPLFFGAGPHADGSFAAERVARNLAAVAGEDPDAWLVQLLDEYVAFALFQAGSMLPRDQEASLAAHVAEVLKPVRALDASTPAEKSSMSPRPTTVRSRREEILDEATQLFAERGYEGTSMADLAERVGLRKASLFHHFASKEVLYAAVLARLVERVGQTIAAGTFAPGTFEERLDNIADSITAVLCDQPFAARLLIREVMDWGPVARDQLADQIMGVLAAAEAFVRAGQEEGAFAKMDPKQLVITLVGIHFMPFAIGHVVKRFAGTDPADKAFVAPRAEAVKDQIRRFARSKV